MSESKRRYESRLARHKRVRRRISGTSERPRLAVFRSGKHMYAQLVDDVSGRSLLALSTVTKTVRAELEGKKKSEASTIVGKKIAELAKEKGISRVTFDRGGFLYHGRIKAFADGAREGGLEF